MSSPLDALSTQLPASSLLAEVYPEVQAIARAYARRERQQPDGTSLAHESLLRLGDLSRFASREALLAATATEVRRVLVDRARRRNTAKRGGGWHQRNIHDVAAGSLTSIDRADLLDLDDALHRLAQRDPRAARVVELRIFGCLELSAIAACCGVSRKTVAQDWAFARSWLLEQIGSSDDRKAEVHHG